MTLSDKIQMARLMLRMLEMDEVISVTGKLPTKVDTGDIVYSLSNGWKITVCNRFGKWDHIDSFQTPADDRLSFDEIHQCDGKGDYLYPDIANYRPDDDVFKRIYIGHRAFSSAA